jgi:chromosome segregation protein
VSLGSGLEADDVRERRLRDDAERLRDRKGEWDVQLTETRLEIDHIAERLRERYDLTLAALPVASGGGEPSEEECARVESLRTRLVRLGDVTPGAIEELDEIRERHGFVQSQRDDLEKSLADLEQTIDTLNRTCRQRFRETFDAANAKLGEVFPQLFPGGKARLELVRVGQEEGEDETEELGVEIVVQPAGKKLQSLNLLSGGEKALTATALVFSLFLIRPTPFCLLDEVDAPLDEANIGRFNQLVRDMATTSQFVVVTHNRRTMEGANTLYGITMEQAGVSKVVSVRLHEAA